MKAVITIVILAIITISCVAAESNPEPLFDGFNKGVKGIFRKITGQEHQRKKWDPKLPVPAQILNREPIIVPVFPEEPEPTEPPTTTTTTTTTTEKPQSDYLEYFTLAPIAI